MVTAFRVAKIGDPDKYLGFGTHVFEIRYRIPGVLDPGSTGADKRFAQSTGDAAAARRRCSSGTSSPDPWNNEIRAGRHLGDAAGRRQPARSVRSASAWVHRAAN